MLWVCWESVVWREKAWNQDTLPLTERNLYIFSTLFISCRKGMFLKKCESCTCLSLIVKPCFLHTLMLTHATHVLRLRQTAGVVFLLIAYANFISRVPVKVLVQSFSWCLDVFLSLMSEEKIKNKRTQNLNLYGKNWSLSNGANSWCFFYFAVLNVCVWKSHTRWKSPKLSLYKYFNDPRGEFLISQLFQKSKLCFFLATITASQLQRALAVTSNHSVTFEPMSPVPWYSQSGVLELTQRWLVQLIAICIALLVSQHCLRDISVFFFSPVSLRLSGSILFLAFWGEELDSVW